MRDPRLFFTGTGAFICGILFSVFYKIYFWYLLVLIFLVVLTACWLAVARSSRVFLCVVALVCFLFGIGRASLTETSLPIEFSSFLNKKVVLDGTIVADPSIRIKNQQIVAQVSYKGASTKILVSTSLYHVYLYGEQVEISGKLTMPQPFATEGGRTFDYAQYLAKSQIFSTMSFGAIRELSPPRGLWPMFADALFGIKHAFVYGLRVALPPPYPALATGLLTGDQHQMDDSVKSMLAVAGLVWVVVLSGYHVTVLAEGIVKATRWLPRRFSYGAAICSVMGIVFATGASAPSLRGGIMACFMLYARATNRTYDSLRALSATALLILLWNPLLIAYDTGFQLSLIVTPALIIGTPILEARLLWIKSAFLRDIIAVSTIAQLAVLPLLLWQSGSVEVWAIIANMFVMPFVPLSMGTSVLAGFAGLLPLPKTAHFIALPAYALLYYLLAIAQITASLPGSDIVLSAFPFVLVLLMYALLMAGLYFLKKSIPPH